MDIDSQVSYWNKMLTNYYNPKNVVEIKYYSRKKLSFIIRVDKVSELLYSNFKNFFKDKRNSNKLGSILKKLKTEYGFVECSGSSFKGFYNPSNWKNTSECGLVFEYVLEVI